MCPSAAVHLRCLTPMTLKSQIKAARKAFAAARGEHQQQRALEKLQWLMFCQRVYQQRHYFG